MQQAPSFFRWYQTSILMQGKELHLPHLITIMEKTLAEAPKMTMAVRM